MTFIKIICLVSNIYFMSMLFPQASFAYLDPGSGSYVLQVFIAGLLSMLYFIKTFWARIKDCFHRIFQKDKHEQ